MVMGGKIGTMRYRHSLEDQEIQQVESSRSEARRNRGGGGNNKKERNIKKTFKNILTAIKLGSSRPNTANNNDDNDVDSNRNKSRSKNPNTPFAVLKMWFDSWKAVSIWTLEGVKSEDPDVAQVCVCVCGSLDVWMCVFMNRFSLSYFPFPLSLPLSILHVIFFSVSSLFPMSLVFFIFVFLSLSLSLFLFFPFELSPCRELCCWWVQYWEHPRFRKRMKRQRWRPLLLPVSTNGVCVCVCVCVFVWLLFCF